VRQEAAGPCLCTCRDIIGETPAMLWVKKLARRASRTSSTLLITGESGTGKEIVAQAIHTRSVRREAPFISVNCGAIPENLLESELFGYVDGAFTGAKKGGKPGKFELANGGTILLDEIGDMPLSMQVKLLRVLQERAVWRIGAMAPTMLDVRVMASTNRDLRQLVADKTFRQDLYYRLNVLEIPLPPLRERLADLPMLAETLIQRINARIGSDATGIQPECLEVLMGHQWPGNVRELENLLEQAVNWSEEPLIDVRNIPAGPARRESAPPAPVQPFRNAVEETERGLIISALSRT
jgi:transcriptional regulator with PAS, ATPase and Fis domain